MVKLGGEQADGALRIAHRRWQSHIHNMLSGTSDSPQPPSQTHTTTSTKPPIFIARGIHLGLSLQHQTHLNTALRNCSGSMARSSSSKMRSSMNTSWGCTPNRSIVDTIT